MKKACKLLSKHQKYISKIKQTNYTNEYATIKIAQVNGLDKRVNLQLFFVWHHHETFKLIHSLHGSSTTCTHTYLYGIILTLINFPCCCISLLIMGLRSYQAVNPIHFPQQRKPHEILLYYSLDLGLCCYPLVIILSVLVGVQVWRKSGNLACKELVVTSSVLAECQQDSRRLSPSQNTQNVPQEGPTSRGWKILIPQWNKGRNNTTDQL